MWDWKGNNNHSIISLSFIVGSRKDWFISENDELRNTDLSIYLNI